MLTLINIVACSILRETSIDGTGWSPARKLKVCVFFFCTYVSDFYSLFDLLSCSLAHINPNK